MRFSPCPGARIPALIGTATTAFILCAVVLCTPAAGTSVLHFDSTELITRADRIAHAVCIGKDTFRDENDRIVTEYSFEVHETLKGKSEGALVFRQPGGSYGDHTLVIVGLSPHEIDDQVVLFLGAEFGSESEYRIPVGLDQGVFRVAPTASGDEEVSRDLSGLNLVRPGSGTGDSTDPDTDDLPEGVDLDSFLAELRKRIRRLEESRDDEKSGAGHEEDDD